ncbi:MAG TPA: DEAD/DEAH box helicase family protein [Candidatus Dormibacteraeota bacterium]|nr:DEAD/DEAH box helicase family protein [Candidatus Dormibacteraeota bacterium]
MAQETSDAKVQSLNFRSVTNESRPEEKIALFRSLFRGREDVYPRRFESRKTGKGGYAPACGNEWVRGICEKPRIKCAECPNRRFLAVSDDVVRQHLIGHDRSQHPFTIGVYPLLIDETCFFLAIDLDGEGWTEDAQALRTTCEKLEIPCALERSRSGSGAHLWIFFEEATPASIARNVGSYLITETMEMRPELGLSSYDRLFPNQDTMPKGGFGNLIALPLQKGPREGGNSVFLDANLKPYEDQWRFLSSVRKLGPGKAEALAQEAGRRGRIIGVRMAVTDEDDEKPWTAPPSRKRKELPIAGPLPAKIDLILGDMLYIEKDVLPAPLRNRLIRLAAFQNPEFYRAQAMRLPTFGKPRVIHCAEETSKHLALPRGCLDEVQTVLTSLKIEVGIRDERFNGTPLNVQFKGQLRAEQQIAGNALLAHDTGVLAATTAFGKTVLASWLIAQRNVNTLVLVHRQQLLEQWIERLAQFLDISREKIGVLSGGRKKLTGNLDVALIQSLARKGIVHDCVGTYGNLIIDECHHLPAASFELIARRAKARFVTGLSASVTRKDGHHPIIFMQCGPVRYRAGAKEQASLRPFTHSVIVRPTGFRAPEPPEADPRTEFQNLYEALMESPARNDMICSDVISAVKAGRFPLVLTERTEHLACLAQKLSLAIANVVTLKGGMSRKEIASALARLRAIEPANTALIATGKYIGEGFDEPRLDTLFLTLPISWRGTIAQYVGRLHRLHDGKKEVQVYDYADLDEPMLSRMFDRRCEGYEAVGYTILLPGSAVPGWPPEVPLPVDPIWKRDYAASVRRLIRDGVDVPLANLFLHAARADFNSLEGVDRARSASEAFLFRRLETLPATSGLFRLNAELPIPFDSRGRMEVDFLCEKGRLVLELDGSQHLNDPEAYRRDRRKDAALQEHGYFVLRFLCQDLGKRLDEVLNIILRTVIRRTRGVL